MDHQKMKSVEKIKEWTSERKAFYFFLPDGPYGRPFDNQYTVESVGITDKGLEVKFNDGLALLFTGEPEVTDEGCNLLITRYEICHFEKHKGLSKSFDYGEVVLTGFK